MDQAAVRAGGRDPRHARPALVAYCRLGLCGVFLAVLLLEACADDSPTAPVDPDASAQAAMGRAADGSRVVIEPHWLTLDTIGVADTLAATVLDAEGDTIDGATVTWTSADTAIATVDGAGVVTSVAFGSTKVGATYNSATAEATVEVAPSLSDREILEILYEAAGGDDWTANTNWLSDKDLSQWHGVGAHLGRVNSLSLSNNNLVGAIPPELGGLDELQSLYLSGNKLSGPIPPELSKFKRLRDLSLSQNPGISGRLPPELGFTGGLEYLTVDETSLTGPVPRTFANLRLRRFYFDRDGPCIPADLEAWLKTVPQKENHYQLCTDQIHIDPQSLHIEAPPLGDTARLTAAVINADGDIVDDATVTWASADTTVATVDSTGLVTSVDYGTTQVTATSDSLTATAQVEIVLTLTDRQVLDSIHRLTGGENWTDTTGWLGDGPLSGWYGVETDSAGKVVGLALGNNNLSGAFPGLVAELGDLVTLDLGRNALAGEIPRELRGLQRLRDLVLNDNSLEGRLPRGLGSMAGLRYLHIGNNGLSGVIPRSFGNLALDTLRAADSGVCVPPSLDEWFDGIGRTDAAARCVASIDIEVVDLPSLALYAIGETGRLSATYVDAEGDTVPGTSFTWSSGDTAVASVNAAGTVTAVGDGATEITAAHNSVTASIEVEVALPESDRDVLEILYDRARGAGWTERTNWMSDEPLSEWAGVETGDSGRVVGLSLRGNNVRGPLHPSIGRLDRLVTLDLSRNWITGQVPAELGDLGRLRDLSLSVNGFSGGLPWELGRLDSLRTLNVAATSLSGMVPASFANLDLESFLVGGTGLCVPPSLATWHDSIPEADSPPACAGRVEIDPSSLTFAAAGDTARLSVRVVDAEGRVVESAAVSWESADPTVARIDTTGLVTARAAGITAVTARYDSATVGAAEVAVSLPGSDRAALEALYRATGGDDWTDNTNWLSDEPLGEWFGVDVQAGGRVGKLSLDDNNLDGRIPAAVGLADSLFILWLGTNAITGPIPPAIGRLQRLRELDLHGTGVTGPLPPELADMAGLRYLNVSDTRLSGPVPEAFYALDLERFYHSGTDLCVPRSLAGWYGSLGNSDPLPCIPRTADREVLVTLYNGMGGPGWWDRENWLSDKPLNTWNGVATDEEGYVTELVLRWNNLTDSIPTELGTLDRLRSLALHGNRLTGRIPPELGSLTRLRQLSLYNNDLTGPIPPELGKLTQVRELSLSGNRLTGSIPPEIGGMVSVDTMYLSRNDLSGPIPAEFGNLVNLEHLSLFENDLSGPLPAAFGKLEKLKTMWLIDNEFEGPLPPELGDMSSLEHISLGRNKITGSIPPELGKLQNLEYLDITDNQLTGPIPPELGNLISLEKLYLVRNRLSGSIPPELGKLADLELMWLFANRLTGPIPAEFGRLASLTILNLGDNNLSGPLPPGLGDLARLEAFHVNDNSGLEGLMPRTMLNLPLGDLDIAGTRVCPHLDDQFQEWLDGVPRARGLSCPPTLTERFALSEFYDAAGGDSWTDKRGWDNDSVVRNRYGVTVNATDSLVRRLALPDNGLRGSLAPEVASLTKLETLDLGDNGLTGGVPVAVASLDALDTIRISGNADMAGPLPFEMTEMTGLKALQYANTGLCASPSATFRSWIDGLDVADGATCSNPEAVGLSLPMVYLTQAIQRPEGDVPLIAGRQALLRTFLVSDRENAFFEPEVVATLTRGGSEVHRTVMRAVDDRLVTSADEGSLRTSYNAVIPAEHVVAGTELVIVADSAGAVPRADGSRTRFPDAGSMPLDVIDVPPFELTVVPVLYAQNPDSSIFAWADSIADDSPQVGLLKYSFPFSRFSATTRDSYVTSLDLTEEDNTWPLVLELELVYHAEGATGYWYGVADSDEGYVRGVARLNGWVSFGKPWDTELAHEVGHSLDLLHAPCGGALGVEPEFPYPNGSIGVWGYDFRDGSLVSPERRRDIMGYCYERGWLSDYYYEKVIRLREEKEGRAARALMAGEGPKSQMLVLWGGVLGDELRLEPVHSMHMAPRLPDGPGPYRVRGIADDGGVEFSLSFTPGEDKYGNKYFFFAIPVEADWQGSLGRIVLTGPEGEVAIDDADTRSISVLTDPSTGRVRSILRDWEGPRVAAFGGAEGLRVETTRGLRAAVRLPR